LDSKAGVTRDEEPVEDYTDYVQRDGKFYPGSMLCSVTRDDNHTEVDIFNNAGILIERHGERHLTCSFHNWEKQHKAHTDAFGSDTAESREIFQAVQGVTSNSDPGTRIGWLCKTFEYSDVALA
jgi:hypothetical protein